MATYKNKEMIKVAHYYYKKGLIQSEIAKKMKMSRPRVNRLLKRAIEENIVQITIEDIDKYNIDLEAKLEEKFNLKQAIVVSVFEENEIVYKLGEAGAEFLEDTLNHGNLLGITWGRTLSEVAKQLPQMEDKNVSIVHLIGGMNIAYTDLTTGEIASTMAKKLGGEPFVLYAPAIVESKEIKDAIMSDYSLKETFDQMDKCDIIMAGIGELKKETRLYREDKFNELYKEHLFSKGCVGDIGFRWFDQEGRSVQHDYNERTIGYNILEKKSKAIVTGIAGGSNKFEAILGALKGKYLDVLITDINTAERLIKNE